MVVVDGNVNTSHLGLHYGVYEDPSVTLREVIERKASALQAIYVSQSGVRILPSPLSGDGVDLKGLDNVIRQLEKDYDIIILDVAPGLGREVLNALGSVDEAIVVATPDIPSVTDALKTINFIKKVDDDIDILGVIVNRTRGEKYELSAKEIESACNIDVITNLPEDKKVPESIARGEPAVILYPNSSISVSMNKLAAALIGQEYEPSGFYYVLMKSLGLIKESFIKIPTRRESRERRESQRKEKKIIKRVEEEEEENEEAENAEAEDVEKISEEIKESIKADIKKRLAMKIKEKLRERGAE